MVTKANPILQNLLHHQHENTDFMDSNDYKDAACLVPHPLSPLCVPTMEGLAVTIAHLKQLRSLDWWVERAMPVRMMDISNELMKNGNCHSSE